MCWSGEASAVIAATGIGLTIYTWRKGEPAPLCSALAYFAGMEALQAVTYIVIDRCGTSANQVLTLLGYVHIALQPFFANAVALYFIPTDMAQRLRPWVYGVCAVGASLTLAQLIPSDDPCRPGRFLCGPHLCAIYGRFHLAWFVPVNGWFNWTMDVPVIDMSHGFPGYAITFWLVPLLYGSWRVVLLFYVAGPLLPVFFVGPNEVPAIWCLESIFLCAIIVKTPLRRWLHVDSWYALPIKTWLLPATCIGLAREAPACFTTLQSARQKYPR